VVDGESAANCQSFQGPKGGKRAPIAGKTADLARNSYFDFDFKIGDEVASH
jgi:hypothetical protein